MDAATIAALDCGSEEIGIAWFIARRSPALTGKQLARAADCEARFETLGRQRRRRGETSEQFRERFLQREIDRRASFPTESDTARREQSENDAREVRELLGELAAPIASGMTETEIGELLGISQGTVSRRISKALRA